MGDQLSAQVQDGSRRTRKAEGGIGIDQTKERCLLVERSSSDCQPGQSRPGRHCLGPGPAVQWPPEEPEELEIAELGRWFTEGAGGLNDDLSSLLSDGLFACLREE